jgi:hypothetical protein
MTETADPAEPGAAAEATITELAARYNVSKSTMSRALRGGRAASRTGNGPGQGQADDADAARPRPVNPGSARPRYRLAEVDAWWPTRPRVGSPVRTGR